VARTYWDPDIVYVEDPRWPGAGQYEGRDAVLRCFQSYVEALGAGDEVSVSVERIHDAGRHQVPFVRFQGRSPSGVPHEHLWAYLVETRDRRIVYLRAYYDPEEALEAAGLKV
jgi:ketosteroid isomerase-like protein